MSQILVICQLVIAFGIFNVWLLRAQRPTPYRGGNARNMEEEFRVYGLSTNCMKIVRAFKLFFAALLVLGYWWPTLTLVGGLGMACLMGAAVFMHMKVRDPIRKSLPAASLLLLSILVAVTSRA
jgi:hypothetical protein